jgi:hypothetical protein
MDENPYTSPAPIDAPTVSARELWPALIPFVIAVPGIVLAAYFWYWRPFSHEANAAAMGVIGPILVFDLTVCVWVLFHWRGGKPPDMSLAPLIPSRQQRTFRRTLRERPKLDDDQFYEAFYANSGIAKHLPIQLRKSLQREFGVNFAALHPADNLIYACEEVDLADVRDRIKLDLGVDITSEITEGLTEDRPCTFDFLLQSTVRGRQAPTKEP